MYCNDNEGWCPTCAWPEFSPDYVPYPDDWIHWQANRNLDDSAIAKYVGRGEKLKNLLRCPADSFEGRNAPPGIAPGQGPFLYSYAMNFMLGENMKEWPGARTKISQWRTPSSKIMLTEPGSKYEGSVWNYVGGPLARRHGTGRFHGNVPGNPAMQFGAMLGINVSAVFVDGHAEAIDQDFGVYSTVTE